ncbi:MAG: type II toxin-antitoxin system death-on-curing family toxin [Chloroflexaceae bacterium]|nr:type II toxin-antitoxin system death-on-curing family toxin [Chloroflexaceae bacterium]NJL35186.1 type II toxin-antitoxin system death-on-curing family toxin [Chloroflexaceae bacterium]NJO07115.1 type II toxin-antitoxin system death-on-curing family toxin [Chloroflexaceae bacterium]
MEYISRDELLDLHSFIVAEYGGLMGIASQDKLTTVINAPRQQMFHSELYPDVCSKAAIMVYMIVKSHPFVSGNDGTALMVMLRFLEKNAMMLRREIGSAELVWLIRALIHSDMDRERLEDWLRANTVPLDPRTEDRAG